MDSERSADHVIPSAAAFSFFPIKYLNQNIHFIMSICRFDNGLYFKFSWYLQTCIRGSFQVYTHNTNPEIGIDTDLVKVIEEKCFFD